MKDKVTGEILNPSKIRGVAMELMDRLIFPLLRDVKLMHTFGNTNQDCIDQFSAATSLIDEKESENNENNRERFGLTIANAEMDKRIGTVVNRKGGGGGKDILFPCLPYQYRNDVHNTSKPILVISIIVYNTFLIMKYYMQFF